MEYLQQLRDLVAVGKHRGYLEVAPHRQRGDQQIQEDYSSVVAERLLEHQKGYAVAEQHRAVVGREVLVQLVVPAKLHRLTRSDGYKN